MWFKRNRIKIIAAIIIIAALAAAFFIGGNSPRKSEDEAPKPVEAVQSSQPEPSVTSSPELSNEPAPSAGSETGKAVETQPAPPANPLPVEPQNAVMGETVHSCTISISCATILNNLDALDPAKTQLVEGGGVFLSEISVEFYEGESVFNVLQRVCRQYDILLEFENTPAYNSAYIEGIGNIYEFDVGELSGWNYSVNGWFPNYGCSRYQLEDGDVIRWLYTCDLGVDIGGRNIID